MQKRKGLTRDLGFFANRTCKLPRIWDFSQIANPFSCKSVLIRFIPWVSLVFIKKEIMETNLLIATGHGGMFFSITYVAAFLVAAAMAIYAGLKKGYPLTTWLLIILSGVVFFVIGNKMLTYTPDQWVQIFTGQNFPMAEKKTVLGGIIGIFAGIFIAKACLRFNRPVLDTLAIALPVAMAISRVGCLMAGCCFGTPTTLPWGIQYDAASWVYQVQLAQGLVHLHDIASLAVHPAQLYQVLGCLVIAFMVWKSKKQWKSEGNLFLFSVLCYAVLRFVVEFVRAPETNAFTGGYIWGLKVIQWLLMGAILPGTFILIYRELKTKSFSVVSPPIHVSERRQVILIILLSMIVFTGRRWFDLMELNTIMLFLIPVGAAVFVKAYQRYTVAGFRWVLPALLIGCISFMAQKSNKAGKENEQTVFTDLGLIGMVGSYYEDVSTVSKVYIPGSCNLPGHYNTSTLNLGTVKRDLWQGGLDVSYNKWVGKYNKFAIGARGFYGSETGEYETDYPNSATFGISPYVTLDWQYIGIQTGFTLGQTKLPIGTKSLNSYNGGEIITTDYNNIYFMPGLSVRLGPPEILFAELSFPGLFPSTAPNALFKAGLGSGLGKTNGTKISVGYCNGLYAQAAYPIKNTVVLEAMYADNFGKGIVASRIFSFGVHFRLDKKTSTVTEKQPIRKSVGIDSRTFSKLSDVVVDVDGNLYHTLALGAQVWMAENLKVTHFRDGSEITGITNNDSKIQYNWLAASDSRKLCPTGWHVPSMVEWTSLFKSLGGADEAGVKLEESFTGKEPAGQWWSTTETDVEMAESFYLNNQTIGVMFANAAKTDGLSVRCMKDN